MIRQTWLYNTSTNCLTHDGEPRNRFDLILNLIFTHLHFIYYKLFVRENTMLKQEHRQRYKLPRRTFSYKCIIVTETFDQDQWNGNPSELTLQWTRVWEKEEFCLQMKVLEQWNCFIQTHYSQCYLDPWTLTLLGKTQTPLRLSWHWTCVWNMKEFRPQMKVLKQ